MIIKTAEQLAAECAARRQSTARAEALAYLQETDWMVVRWAETGKLIPPDVAAQRESARKTAGAALSGEGRDES